MSTKLKKYISSNIKKGFTKKVIKKKLLKSKYPEEVIKKAFLEIEIYNFARRIGFFLIILFFLTVLAYISYKIYLEPEYFVVLPNYKSFNTRNNQLIEGIKLINSKVEIILIKCDSSYGYTSDEETNKKIEEIISKTKKNAFIIGDICNEFGSYYEELNYKNITLITPYKLKPKPNCCIKDEIIIDKKDEEFILDTIDFFDKQNIYEIYILKAYYYGYNESLSNKIRYRENIKEKKYPLISFEFDVAEEFKEQSLLFLNFLGDPSETDSLFNYGGFFNQSNFIKLLFFDSIPIREIEDLYKKEYDKKRFIIGTMTYIDIEDENFKKIEKGFIKRYNKNITTLNILGCDSAIIGENILNKKNPYENSLIGKNQETTFITSSEIPKNISIGFGIPSLIIYYDKPYLTYNITKENNFLLKLVKKYIK